MKGTGMKIYRHQFGLYSENHDVSRRHYGTDNRYKVFHHGDLKPKITIKRGKARIVGWKRVNKPWLKRNYKPDSHSVSIDPQYNSHQGRPSTNLYADDFNVKSILHSMDSSYRFLESV